MGRPKADDPRIRLVIYVKTSKVNKHGGSIKAQRKAVEYLEQWAGKTKK